MATAAPTPMPSASSRRKAAGKRSSPSDSANGPSELQPENETAAKKVKLSEEPVKIKKESEVLTFDWTSDDLTQLIGNLSNCLPKVDNVKYSTLTEKLDWEKVRFGEYSASECKEKWIQIMTRLRRFRTLTDMVTDAREWLKHPWSSYTNSKKQKHPEMPKKPLTPYFRYFLEKREKYSREHPDMSMTDLAKLLSQKFQLLQEKKKLKYKESYEREIEVYKKELQKFKREHPEEFPVPEPKHNNSIQEGPFKPLTPFQIFQADRSKRPEYIAVDKKVTLERIRKQWSSLSDGKRIKWIRKAVQDEHRYGAELTQYCEGNPNFKADPIKTVLSKAEKELKDRYDGKPDRPPNSGYSMFSKIMLRELKDVPAKEKMGEISRRWKLLSENERDAYNKQAQKANQKYKEKYAAYLSSLVDEERQKIEAQTKNMFLKKTENGSDKSEKKESDYRNGLLDDADGLNNRPKKPSSAMFFYQQEKFPIFHQKYPGLSKQELMRLMVREFSELSDKKKEKYRRLAEEERKRAETLSKPKPKSEGPTEVSSRKRKLFKGEPKKPAQSGYGAFSTEMLSNLTEIDPKSRMAEIAKRWKVMPPAEKDKYKKKAEDLMDKYNKDHNKFLSTLTAEELEEYNLLLRAKASKKHKAVAVKVNTVNKNVKEIKKESESESSDDDDDDDGSSDDDDSDQSDNEDGEESGSEESGSDSDDDDDDSDDGKKGGKNDSSSADTDSDSDSGTGSSDDSSDSGSDSEEE